MIGRQEHKMNATKATRKKCVTFTDIFVMFAFILQDNYSSAKSTEYSQSKPINNSAPDNTQHNLEQPF